MTKTNEVSEAQQRGNYRLVANKAALLFIDAGGKCTLEDVEVTLDRANKDFLLDMPSGAFAMAAYNGFQMGEQAVQADARIRFLRKRADEGLTYAQVDEAIDSIEAVGV